MVIGVFSKTIKRRNRPTWLSWLTGQTIYLANGLEIKEARLLNWDPYEATRKDKLAPSSPQSWAPHNTLALSKPSSNFSVMPTLLQKKWAWQSTVWSHWYICKNFWNCPTPTQVADWILSYYHYFRSWKAVILRHMTYAFFLNKNYPKCTTSSVAFSYLYYLNIQYHSFLLQKNVIRTYSFNLFKYLRFKEYFEQNSISLFHCLNLLQTSWPLRNENFKNILL